MSSWNETIRTANEKGFGNMIRRSIGIWAILWWFLFSPPFSFAGEIYRWTDGKGVVYFTERTGGSGLAIIHLIGSYILNSIDPQYKKPL